MGHFSRALQHLDMKDVKRKRLKEIAAQKLKEQADAYEKKVIKEISKKYKSDWKREIYEGMTTANALTQTLPASDLENVINDTPTTNADVFADGPARENTEDNFSYDAMVGTNIKSSGSGSGNDGGFNIGDHVAFDGTGLAAGARWCILKAVDTTKVDFMVIRAIVGNGSNGGETPDDANEGLMLYYKNSDMDDYIPITYNPTLEDSDFKGGSHTIIPVNIGSYGDTLRDYYKQIPDYARTKDTRFLLYQFESTAANRDTYGITNISYRRLTPINVVVPLDDPEAVSFVRVGSDEGDPKKRKKKLNDQLAASDEYTKTVLGNQFPGQGARIDGEDPFRSAPLTPDDVIDASPIGKGEVKKSFSSFSADTADATATDIGAEDPEVITTRQSTIATDPEGNEIDPEPVEAGAVQGADATNLDQDEPTEPEPEPTSPDQEETEQELETAPSVDDKSKEELNKQLDDKANALQKLLTMRVTRDLDGFKNLAKVAKFAVQGFLGMMTIADRLNPFKKQNTETNALQGGLSVILNSLDIAVSVMDGKVTKSNPTAAQIETYKNSILPDLFKSDSASYIPISDIRHEYADDNIYVERINGKAVVRDNTSGIKQNLTFKGAGVGGNYKGFEQVGGGYSQFVIPKDGGEPYVHYYDYNYENINNPADVAFGGGVLESGKFDAGALMKSLSNIIHQLRPSNTKLPIPTGAKTSLAGYFTNFQDVLGALQTTSTLEGWPPGIHGAALTDITIPLSELPEETQKLIASHPLSWTPERIANMSREDFMTQFGNRSTDRFEFDFAANNFKNYDAFVLKALEDPDSGVDPEFLKNYKRYGYAEYDEKTGTHPDAEKGTVEYDYDMAKKELDKIVNTPEYSAASQAAFKEYEDVLAERDKKIDEVGEKYDTSKLWEKYVGPHYRAVERMINSGNSVGDENPTYRKMKEGYEKYQKQSKVYEKKLSVERSALMDEYGKLSDEAIARYNDTVQVRKLDDGTMGLINGGDFKTKNGKIIKGMDTLSAKQQARFDEVRAEYEEVQEYLRSANWDDNYIKPYVLYDVKTSFAEYGISGDSWSPENRGSGEGSENQPKPKPNPRSGYAGLDDPIVGAGNKKDDEEKIAANYNDFVDPLDKMIKKLEKQNKNLSWPKSDPDDPFRFSQGHRTSSYELKGNPLLEKYANPNGDNYSLFERLKQKKFFNPNDIKPTFPENPPPQLDPKTGMHPNYGKHAKRYNKLDPISANSMPPTGDPETDATVDKQRTKPKTKLYDRLKKNIRKDLTNK